jgi:hypothetical protein
MTFVLYSWLPTLEHRLVHPNGKSIIRKRADPHSTGACFLESVRLRFAEAQSRA